MQEIKLDKHIKLLDCPGIVMSKDEDSASLALKNCIKVENLVDPIAPVDLLLKRCNKEQLILRYKIENFEDSIQFLTQVAKRHGKVRKGGIADIRKAAQLVLNDWTSGRLSYYTQPPKSDKVIETKIVTQLAPAFDIDALLKDDEQDMFNEIDDTKILVHGLEAMSAEPIKVNFDRLEQENNDEDDKEDSDEYEDMEEAEESEDEQKEIQFKSDVVLNPKLSKKLKEKNHLLLEQLGKQTNDKTAMKRKAIDIDDENEIYEAENIPRTKKMQKLDKKREIKKAKRNGMP
jgi:nuclear GTP-binding protein